MILRNVGNYLPVDTASLSVRLEIFNLTALRTFNTELREIFHGAIEIPSVNFAGESEKIHDSSDRVIGVCAWIRISPSPNKNL